MVRDEFPLIACYLNRVRSSRPDVELGIGDGHVLLNIPEKQILTISTDTPVAGNHSLHDTSPADLVYKALVVNLNDLAAMGVDPARLTLALTLSDVDEAWPELFSNSLFDLLNYYDMQLIGGDTTRGPSSMTLGTHGFVPIGRVLTCSGAKLGDWIYATGTSGDSATGLAILQNRLQATDAKDADYLIKRHLRPLLRILQGQALRDLANPVIDLSDGLISDLRHTVKASDCGARIDPALPPFSDALSHHAEPEQALRWALSGGEDYELCLTMSELDRGALDVALGHLDVPFTCIGQMTVDIEGLCFIRNGESVMFDWKEYDHFTTSQRRHEKSPEDE